MFKIEINKQPYRLYTTLDDISIQDYSTFIQKFKGKDLTGLDDKKEMLFHLSDIPKQLKPVFPAEYVEPLLNNVTSLFLLDRTDNLKAIEEFAHLGVTYKAAPSIIDTDGTLIPMRNATVEQFVFAVDTAALIEQDLQESIYQHLPEILSYLFTADGAPLNRIDAGITANIFKTLPVSIALSAYEYFLTTHIFIHDTFKMLFQQTEFSKGSFVYGEKMKAWGWKQFIYEMSDNPKDIQENYKINLYEFLTNAMYNKMKHLATTDAEKANKK